MTTTIKELDVPVPDYMDRFLATLAEKTGMAKEDIALFFLLQEAGYASDTKTNSTGASLTNSKTGVKIS